MENMSHLSEGDTPRPELSEPQEDYLKQIFLLGGDGKRVSTQALATRLRVQPASVTGIVKRLAETGYVEIVDQSSRLFPQEHNAYHFRKFCPI